MSDVIASQPSLLQMISRFGIQLGVGEKTVREVCEASKVDTTTFLAVANVMKQGATAAGFYIDKIDMPTMMRHLESAHEFFLDFQLPHIRRKLLEAIDCSRQNEVAFLILKFYDEYMHEVRKHMGDLLCYVLFSIYNSEADLRAHCDMEDSLFFPAVQLLEERIANNQFSANTNDENEDGETLTERERQIVACVVRGLTNREVAEQLFISINTVLTHRRNISRKLDIHSVSGLTIYAIVNGIVQIDEVSLN